MIDEKINLWLKIVLDNWLPKMSSIDARYPAASGGGSYSPPDIKPQQKTSLPAPPSDPDSFHYMRCATGVRFLSTIHGVLNIIIFVSTRLVLENKTIEFYEFRSQLFVSLSVQE